MKNAIFSAITSTSVVYGNVSAAIKEYVLNIFPKDYFGYTHVSSEISYRTLKRFHGSNNQENLTSKHRPYLYIQPEYSGADSDLFLYGTPMVTNFDGHLNGAYDARFLSTVLEDPDKGYRLRFKMNHDRIEYTCRVQVDTLHEAIDQYKALRNAIVWDRTRYYRTSLESLIPRSIMAIAGKLSGIDINTDAHYAQAFLSRLNSLSQFPITYKIKNSSQKDEFFLYYNHNLLVTFTDISVPSPSRNGMLDGFYEFNFRITVEFNLPAVYYIENCTNKTWTVDLSLVDLDTYRGTKEIIPLYTIKNLFVKYPHSLGEYTYYMHFIFNVEDDTKESDTIEMAEVFQNKAEDFDTYHVLNEAGTHGEVSSPYIKIFIIKNEEDLEEGKDFEFDLLESKLYLRNLDKDATYRCIVYLNLTTINERKLRYIESKKKDKSHL